MPRRARIIIPGGIHHVLNRGNNKQVIFFDDEDFRFFLSQIKKYKKKFGVKIYHYCLMPNHYHFLVEPETKKSLAGFMQGLMMVYAQHVKRKYDKVGHIWQGRYKSPLIERENYLIRCGRYIEDNPRRAGLVGDLRDWPWSSYHFYAYGKPDSIVDTDPNYLILGRTSEERQENYRTFVIGVQSEKEIKEIRQKLDQGIFGGENFIKEIVEKFKIKLKGVVRRGPRGPWKKKG